MKGSWILLVLLSLGGFATAQQAVIRDDTDESVFMPYDLIYLIDSTNQLTVNDVTSEKYATGFHRHTDYQNKDFRTNTAYWIRMSIVLDPGSEKVWLLEFYDQTIDQIDAYISGADGFKSI